MTLLPMSTGHAGEDHRYAGLLGANTEADSTETLKAMREAGFKPDWVIADHYAIDASWESRVRNGTGCLIMAIDDVADRAHDCDILLDQNLVVNMETRYRGLISEQADTLLGPHYVLLQPTYRHWHDLTRDRGIPTSRVLCYFGAGDPNGLTLAALEALLDLERADLNADIVLGPYARDRSRISALASEHPRITIHEKLPSLAGLMVTADLALGAGGATSWERICLGLPALVVTLADNQRPIASSLHDRNLVRWMGEGSAVGRGHFRAALQDNLRPGGTDWFDRGLAASIDGRGTDRVVAAILGRTKARQD